MASQDKKHLSGAEARKMKKRRDEEDKELSGNMSNWLLKKRKTSQVDSCQDASDVSESEDPAIPVEEADESQAAVPAAADDDIA